MKEFVRTILDYPVKGIQFRDITTLLQNAGHFKQVIDEMTIPWIDKKISSINLPGNICCSSPLFSKQQACLNNNVQEIFDVRTCPLSWDVSGSFRKSVLGSSSDWSQWMFFPKKRRLRFFI